MAKEWKIKDVINDSLYYCLLLFLTCSFSSSYATGYQTFSTLAYDNPASLNAVKKGQLILGNNLPWVKMHFTGFDGPFHGEAFTSKSFSLPYARLAWRFTPKVVASFDMTHPILSAIQYPPDSVVRSSIIDNILIDTDYSPKLSCQINDKLTIGAGFNANNLSDVKLSFSAPPYGEVLNKGYSWAYGWDVGLSYVLSKRTSTSLNLSYYSEIDHNKIRGPSYWGPFTTRNQLNLVIPGTFTANLSHSMTSSWVLNATGRYIQWYREKNLQITNSALGGGTTVFVPLNYKNSWNAQLATRYQLSQKWAARLFAQYERNPQPLRFRPIGLPTDRLWILSGGMDYAISKKFTAQLTYLHVFSHPPINTVGPVGPTMGNVKIGVNVIDLGFVLNLT
jgi:long-chain fatty acid transport protein